MTHQFALGWDPQIAGHARDRMRGRYVSADFADDRPLPPAFSLARFRQWPFDQGPVGTCYANGTTQAFQIHTAADGNYVSVPLSRRYVAYQTKLIEGGGNPADGGSVADAYQSMEKGTPHEALWPYIPDRRSLAEKPGPAVITDAGLNRLSQIAEVGIGDGWKRALFNGHPIGIGIWWPYGWDTSIDRTGRATGIGRGTYGHALAVIGWHDAWDSKLWWQIENSHGPIYHPIPENIAKQVTGYVPALPDKTYDFWVTDEWLREVLGYGNAESLAAAGLTGFAKRPNVYSIAKAIRPIRKLS